MDDRTLKALRGSIKKWEGVAAGTEVDKASTNCPLCTEFVKHQCNGCPVKENTGQSDCMGTPYVSFNKSSDRTGKSWSPEGAQAGGPESRAAALAESNYLKALLPPGVSAEEPEPEVVYKEGDWVVIASDNNGHGGEWVDVKRNLGRVLKISKKVDHGDQPYEIEYKAGRRMCLRDRNIRLATDREKFHKGAKVRFQNEEGMCEGRINGLEEYCRVVKFGDLFKGSRYQLKNCTLLEPDPDYRADFDG